MTFEEIWVETSASAFVRPRSTRVEAQVARRTAVATSPYCRMCEGTRDISPLSLERLGISLEEIEFRQFGTGFERRWFERCENFNYTDRLRRAARYHNHPGGNEAQLGLHLQVPLRLLTPLTSLRPDSPRGFPAFCIAAPPGPQ